LRAHRHELVERAALRRPCVRGRDHAERTPLRAVRAQAWQQQAQAVPAHERAQQVDPVCGRDLAVERMPDARLAPSVHQEVAGRQGHVRTLQDFGATIRLRPRLEHRQQRLGRGRDGLSCRRRLHVLLAKELQEVVADNDLLLDPVLLRHPAEHAVENTGDVPREQFVGVRGVERVPRRG
jgi:hypothetical protein